MAQPVVILEPGILDETPQHELIFRGVLTPESLRHLKVADYQREVVGKSTITSIRKAMDSGSVPDIELGMRGQNFFEPKPGVIHLLNDIYIIDGLQRVTAGLEKIHNQDTIPPHIGAVVHLNTTEEWERERFRITNVLRAKLSPNVLLRNYSADYKAIEALLTLNADKNFVMREKVSWRQKMSRSELITALTLCKVVGRLHAHLTPTGSTQLDLLVPAIQRVYDKIGVNAFKANIKKFFEIVDTAWGIKRIAFREGAVYIRTNFLLVLARVFSSHLDFWDDNKLVVDKSIISKLGIFPYQDPSIQTLAAGSTKAADLLYNILKKHIDSGKRTRRLRYRYGEETADSQEPEIDEDEGEEENGNN